MKVRGGASAARPGLEPHVQGDDVQDVQVLALVLVDALDLHVEHRLAGRPSTPGACAHVGGELLLVGALDVAPAPRKPASSASGSSPRELLEVA